jgi:putative endonuclease
MFTVYILYSASFNKTYTGQTKDFANRLLEHNETAIKGYSIKYRPWVVIHQEIYNTRAEAMKREKFLKTWEGRIWVKAVLDSFLNNNL